MHKKKIQKLILNRESLRNLTTPRLREVAGGLTLPGSHCNTCLIKTECRSCIPPC
jgi:hypothetical protein